MLTVRAWGVAPLPAPRRTGPLSDQSVSPAVAALKPGLPRLPAFHCFGWALDKGSYQTEGLAQSGGNQTDADCLGVHGGHRRPQLFTSWQGFSECGGVKKTSHLATGEAAGLSLSGLTDNSMHTLLLPPAQRQNVASPKSE